jgi:hypothetical protein
MGKLLASGRCSITLLRSMGGRVGGSTLTLSLLYAALGRIDSTAFAFRLLGPVDRVPIGPFAFGLLHPMCGRVDGTALAFGLLGTREREAE